MFCVFILWDRLHINLFSLSIFFWYFIANLFYLLENRTPVSFCVSYFWHKNECLLNTVHATSWVSYGSILRLLILKILTNIEVSLGIHQVKRYSDIKVRLDLPDKHRGSSPSRLHPSDIHCSALGAVAPPPILCPCWEGAAWRRSDQARSFLCFKLCVKMVKQVPSSLARTTLGRTGKVR